MLKERELKEELHALAAEGVGSAYISGILTFGGSLGRDEKSFYLTYSSHDYLLAWEFACYLSETYDYHAEVGIKDPGDKRRSRIYSIEVRGRCAYETLTDLGKVTVEDGAIISLDLGVKSRIPVAKDLQEYTRAVFLSTGSLTRAAEGLRLSMAFELESDADAFLALLARGGISMTKAVRGEKYTIGTRRGQTISDFCALMGANKSVLVVNDMIVRKELDGNTARAGNLMLANTDKSVSAAIRQYNDAVTIRDGTGGFLSVPAEIKEVASARIENPDISIEELARCLPGKITKSGLYHRLKKMHELAEKIREESK